MFCDLLEKTLRKLVKNYFGQYSSTPLPLNGLHESPGKSMNLVVICKIRTSLCSLSDPSNVSPVGATHPGANLALITGWIHSLEFCYIQKLQNLVNMKLTVPSLIVGFKKTFCFVTNALHCFTTPI